MFMNDELQKNLCKGIIIAIFVIGGIGPFTFLKGCFKSDERLPSAITTTIPTTVSSNSSETNYGGRSWENESQNTVSDKIYTRNFSYIGTYDYLGNDAGVDGDIMDLEVEINLTKNEIVCNGSYSELNNNEFYYGGTKYRLTSSNGELYNHLVGKASNGMLYFHYEATDL